jgi:prophage regulatory protein
LEKPNMPGKILLFGELAERGVPDSRRQLDRKEADPDLDPPFPKRVPVGPNRVGWLADEIDDYVSTLISRRSTEPGTLGSAVGPQRKRGRASHLEK